jgi:hypothetical protein
MSRNKSLHKVSTVIRKRALVKTVLPKNLYLDEEQLDELLQLESTFDTELDSYYFIDRFNILETSNVGIHYFCIENKFALDQIGLNEALSIEMAFLLFEKLEADEILSNSVVGYRHLLDNSVVLKNSELFQTLCYKFERSFKNRLTAAMASIVYSISIDNLMFLLDKRFVEGSGYYFHKYNFDAALREPEILAWVEKNVPDLKDVPPKWILKVYGLERIEELDEYDV